MALQTAFRRFWEVSELKIHVGKSAATKKDLLQLALTDKATCALLLPLLYENIRIAIADISAIAATFKRYPIYPALCKRLRLDSPDEVELAHEREFEQNRLGDDDDDEADLNARYEPEQVVWAWGDDPSHSLSPSEASDPADWIIPDGQQEDDDEDEDDDEAPQFPAQLAAAMGVDEAQFAAMADGPDEFHQALGELEWDDETDGPSKAAWDSLLQRFDRKEDDPELVEMKARMEESKAQMEAHKTRIQESMARHNKACEDLLFVLEKLSEAGRLESFEWVWDSIRRSWECAGAQSELWAALEKNAPSLKKLVVTFFRGDKKTWTPFASANYSSLRVLYIDMANAHHWSARPLHDMLKHLPKLEALDIRLTWCCSVQDMTLAATYPNLRYFSYESGGLDERQEDDEPAPEAFLQRHPNIDTLHLDIDRYSHLELDPACDLPRLRAVSYGRFFKPAQSALGDLVARRAVLAVRCNVKAGLLTFVRLPASASATVKWLDVKYRSNFRLDLANYAEALRAVPGLVELTIRTRSQKYNRRLTPLDLVDTLKALPADHKSLTALTLFDPDGDALTQHDLEDLPSIPPALKYLAWEVANSRVLYRLEKQGDKTVAVEIPFLRKHSWVWTHTSILDHFDNEVEVWRDPFDGDEFP